MSKVTFRLEHGNVHVATDQMDGTQIDMHAAASSAVSLKRIADTLDARINPAPGPELVEMQRQLEAQQQDSASQRILLNNVREALIALNVSARTFHTCVVDAAQLDAVYRLLSLHPK